MDFVSQAVSGQPLENIWIASSDGDITRVQQLLNEGLDVNIQDDVGYSAM